MEKANADLEKALADYSAADVGSWRVEQARHEAQERMNAALAKERRALNKQVRAILAEARPGWWLIRKADVHVRVNHAVVPRTCTVHASIDLAYSAGRRGGDLRLHGNWRELDALLGELRALVVGVAGAAVNSEGVCDGV
jgi:hypothetical protein